MEKGWLGDAADEPAFDFECNHHFLPTIRG